MKAVQYRTIGGKPEVVDIERPEPGPGQVLLNVTAAGLCHSDDFIMSLPAEAYSFGLPLTLGHEGAGTVAALGAGVTGIEVGENVIVYGPWGCGLCQACAAGFENYCTRAASLGIAPPGLGAPGALAEYLVVDSPRHLVPIGDLDPVAAVPLTDAGLTPYHAIKRAQHRMFPGSTTVVIGAGGLGHVAIKLLRLLTGTRVIALDLAPEKLELATASGAHEVLLSNAEAAGKIRELTKGNGADVVLDFVGAQPTADTAVAAAGINAHILQIGAGAVTVPMGLVGVPYGLTIGATYWGGRTELAELVALAASGDFTVETETFTLDEAPAAYEKLHAGAIRGRAVVIP